VSLSVATPDLRTVFGNKRIVLASITFDASYPTGGEALTAAELGLSSLDHVIPLPHASRIGVWDDTNSKIKLYTALGTEAANTSDQSTIVLVVLAIGN
jgi:hypothetical protein